MTARAVDPARSRIVLVGTPAYDHLDLPDVPVVANNVSDLAEVFTDPNLGGFNANHCTIASPRADIAQIGDLLHDAAEEAEDLLLFYYSGHGMLGPLRQELYLGLAATKPDRLAFTALPFDAIRDACLGSRAKSRVVILDSCFSGRAISDTLSSMDEKILGQIQVSGTYTLASAPANRTALILPGERNTAFTGRLLDLLRAGSEGAGPLLSLGDIYRHLYAKLLTEGLPVPQQRGTETADLLGLVRNRCRPVALPRSWDRPGEHLLSGRGMDMRSDQPVANGTSNDPHNSNVPIVSSGNRGAQAIRSVGGMQRRHSADATAVVIPTSTDAAEGQNPVFQLKDDSRAVSEPVNSLETAAAADLAQHFRSSNATVVTEYRGLTVAQLKELRRALGTTTQYIVVKNSLINVAARETGVECLDESTLKGPLAIAFIKGDPVEAAKGLRDFAKANPRLVIKGGVMEGKTLTPADIIKVADLASREVLLAKAAGAMKASLANAVGLFQAPLAQAAGTIGALSVTTRLARHSSVAARGMQDADPPTS